MPRLPFQMSCRAAGKIAALVLALLIVPSAFAAPPVPQITISATEGMAPFTVHVHGLQSSLGAGTQNTARYQWNFGDKNGAHNKLVGWNAAHVYNRKGTYTIKLRVTNEDGEAKIVSRTVKVNKPNRNKVYISYDGNDNNPGTFNAPIKTVARANQMLQDDTHLRFRRGGTYNLTSSLHINNKNVMIGAYGGTGNRPVLYWTPNSQYNSIISMSENARDVVVEQVVFDTPFQPNNVIARGVQANGNNVTVRNCHFAKISYGINCELDVERFLLCNNTAGNIGAYLVWGQGSDHVYVGNTVANSTHEHNIRLGHTERLLIARNDLTNQDKSSIWCMLGQDCYITENILRHGRLIVGPNFAVGGSGDRSRWVVVEGNEILDEGVILYAGAEHVMLRNNVVRNHGSVAFSVWGYYPPMNRTVKDVAILNNTGINLNTQTGRFIKIGDGAEYISACNNLHVATGLNSGVPAFAANVYSDDNSLNTHEFRNNTWAHPSSGDPRHFIGGTGKTVAQWLAMNQTTDDLHRNFSNGDLNGDFAPQFNANTGKKVAGVHVDINGKKRPVTGNWKVGAVQ